MKEHKLPEADGTGSEVIAVPSLCQHPGEMVSLVGAGLGPEQASKALDISLVKLPPTPVTWESLEIQGMIYVYA